MSFYSRKCVECKEPSKRCVKKSTAKDEKGKYMYFHYECDNYCCTVNKNRFYKKNKRGEKREK